jgi:hypothetical protein
MWAGAVVRSARVARRSQAMVNRMIQVILEYIFVAFPLTFMATIAGAVAGGYFFGPLGAIPGCLVGLVCGIFVELRLQPVMAASSRAKWAGMFFIVGLLITIGAVAIATR